MVVDEVSYTNPPNQKMDIREEIQQIADDQTTSQADKTRLLEELLVKDIDNVNTFIKHMVNSKTLGLIITRPVISWIIRNDNNGNIIPPSQRERVLVGMLELISNHLVSFEEQDAEIRFQLADMYENNGSFFEAANVLKPIKLDSGQRFISDRFKLKTWIRIVCDLLEIDDTVGAELYLNRAALLLPKLQSQGDEDEELKIRFKLCQARILDSQCKFLDACMKYYQLSTLPIVHQQDRNLCLSSAIICGVLSPAGPDRSRVLSNLYRDIDSPEAVADEFTMLENMYMDKLITIDEKEKFSHKLSKHHSAFVLFATCEMTVLDCAVIQHNLLAASKIYLNINLLDLPNLLGISSMNNNIENIQEMAAQILSNAKINAKIDQVDNFIYFDPSNKRSGIIKNNIDIENICLDIETISQKVTCLYPNLAV